MDYLTSINRAQFKQMLDEQRDFVLIDVLPPEFYNEVHITGAVNACVYEINFVEQVDALVGDRARSVVVYANSTTSKAGEVALQKLKQAGYTAVQLYKGGTIDWRRAGQPVEGTQAHVAAPMPKIENRTYNVDPSRSGIEWIGRNVTGTHHGLINIESGTIPIHHGLPSNASFTLDMNSIQDLDIQDPTLNGILVEHLKSDDFFDVAKHPTAKFVSKSFKPIENTKPGAVNYNVTGQLTIKGVTNEISFPAVIILNEEDKSVSAEAHFDIDRTLWNVCYGSGKFFEKLGRHLVYDIITIQLKLVAV